MSDDERNKQIAELTKTLKEGERLLGPTKRPDGTLRKPIRIRAGYTPQDEVPIYQPKPALVRFLILFFSLFFFLSTRRRFSLLFPLPVQLKKEMGSAGPPGYDPDADARPKTKSVKRNERKKEKRLQVTEK